MIKRWVLLNETDTEQVAALSGAINVNSTLASILVRRGITAFDQAKAFFRPSLNMLHDPFLMADMEKAVDRLIYAVSNDEKILVYGDYDVDGTTSVAMFYDFLSSIHPHTDYYIPDRYKEGYGVSQEGMQWAHDNDYSLVVTLDCGIKAESLVAEAKDKWIDFIICDHHQPGENLPPAFAILDPKRNDCQYPFKELSGCGVGFKLLQAFCQRMGKYEEKLYQYLDLLAVSIASDIVPITGENRILVYHGLQKLNQEASPGLQALIDLSGIKGEVDISSIVFGIGPRINAAGRISHASAAVALLLSKDQQEATRNAQNVDHKNDERRSFDANTTKEALEMIDNDHNRQVSKSTVLFKNDWHKGVIGIVASRCIEKYHRPTVIMTESNNLATGSARSVPGFDIYTAIANCSDLLLQYGGHRYAAGLTMSLDNVPDFQKRFEQEVAKNISEEQLVPKIDIDEEINFDRISTKFLSVLKQMAPFGPGNMQPVFIAHNVFAYSGLRILKDRHLKFLAAQELNKNRIEAIAFGFGIHYKMVASGMRFRMAFTIEENNYMGNVSMQLNVKDIKFD